MHKTSVRRSRMPTAASGMVSGIRPCRAECRSAKCASRRSRDYGRSTSRPARSGTKRMHKPSVPSSQGPTVEFGMASGAPPFRAGCRSARFACPTQGAERPPTRLAMAETAAELRIGSVRGAIVYRLGHRPFKAERRVRFPLALPKKPSIYRGFCVYLAARGTVVAPKVAQPHGTLC